MVQVLTYSGDEQGLQGDNVVINKLHDAQSLDEFEINIISLQDKNLWYYRGSDVTSINEISDLKSLSMMLKNSKKAQNIILYPQNYLFYYDTRYARTSDWSKCEIKNILESIRTRILKELFSPMANIEILYENTTTNIQGESLSASFCFSNVNDEVFTKSIKSDKVTTFKCGEIILSTLKLEKYQEIILFLKELRLLKEQEDVPAWMEEIKMFDDNQQLQIVEENNQVISRANDNISVAMKTLEENNRYKSILYTNSDELVEVVIEVLEKMLGCNLADFVDVRKEDFRFELDDVVFIGEIKGVTPNVKKANVSQVDQHVQEYLDDFGGEEKKIVALLIINHQRNKPLCERESIPAEQIRLAERNGTLIVETITLLKLFEMYLNNEMTRERCVEVFKHSVGLLTI